MKQREIWLLLDSRQVGGIESHVLNLACGLKSYGLPVKIIMLEDYGAHPLVFAATSQGIEVGFVNGGIRRLYQLLKVSRPWLLHTHGYKAGILGRLCARLAHIPVISTFHAGEPGRGRLKLYNWLDRLTAPLAATVAVSQLIAAKLPKTTTVLKNFVSLPKSVNTPLSSNIAFVGRLSDEKGPDIFFNMARAFPTTSFHVYGSGPMDEVLREHQPQNVIMHGCVTDMEEEWRNIGLLCISSRHEGMPMVALEAMAHGVPVAAFAVGALPQLIEHGVNGYLAGAGCEADLTAYIDRWLHASTLTKRTLAERARQHIQDNYATERVMPSLLSVYLDAVRGQCGWAR